MAFAGSHVFKRPPHRDGRTCRCEFEGRAIDRGISAEIIQVERAAEFAPHVSPARSIAIIFAGGQGNFQAGQTAKARPGCRVQSLPGVGTWPPAVTYSAGVYSPARPLALGEFP